MSPSTIFGQTKAKVLASIEELRAFDHKLFEYDSGERSITHKFAEHLQRMFNDLDVDCEYNRYQFDSKQMLDPALSKKRFVYPDIVVHRRGCQSRNLLVIEAKRRRMAGDRIPDNDRSKLVRFTSMAGDFKYEYGLFIAFDRLRTPALSWFENGHEI